jgi:transposase
MAKSYRRVDRDQQFLLPTDMGLWLAPDHFVWFLIDVVDQLDMTAFAAVGRRGGVGRQAYDPRLLLGLLVYGYATGQRSSRRIEDLCHTDVAYRVLCAQDVPDHSTISRFRQTHHDAVADLFVQVLALAGKAGLGRVGIVAIDGTKIAANASVGANRKRSWLREQVDQMMVEADTADAGDDALFGEGSGDEYAPGWADRATRKERIKAALTKAETQVTASDKADLVVAQRWQERIDGFKDQAVQARVKAQERFDSYHAKLAKAEADGTRRPGSKCPDSPDDYETVTSTRARVERQERLRDASLARKHENAGQRADPRINISDPDSGPMPTAKGWIQGYNAQLVVSDDQLILAALATDQPADVVHYTPMIEAAQAGIDALNTGRGDAEAAEMGIVTADAGYLSEANLSAPGPDRLIATGKRYELEKAAQQRSDQPQPAAETEPSTLAEAMARRLETDTAMQTYRRRGVTVEPVNGHLKDRIGLRQFSRRGIQAVQAELVLAASVANLLKIYRHGR